MPHKFPDEETAFCTDEEVMEAARGWERLLPEGKHAEIISYARRPGGSKDAENCWERRSWVIDIKELFWKSKVYGL